MAERSPKHGLSRGQRGWYRRVNGRPTWIVSAKVAPTGEDADAVYERDFADLWAAPKPAKPAGLTLSLLFDAYIDAKRRKRAARSLEPGTLAQVHYFLQPFLDVVGDKPVADLGPADFARAAAHWADKAPRTRRSFMVAVRGAFRWGNRPPLNLPVPPMGDEFTPPGARELRRHKAKARAKHGAMAFSPDEVRAQLAGTTIRRSHGRPFPIRPSVSLRAMILLAVNCGFGQGDCAAVPRSAFDLKSGWLDFPRFKTGAERRAKLWPETVAAVRGVLAMKRKAKRPADAGLLLLTSKGLPYLRVVEHREDYVERRDRIGVQYRKLLTHLDQRREGRNFYGLRKTFRTIAAETGQELAVRKIMGHLDDAQDMAHVYTVDVRDEVLERVADHVRNRIFGSEASP